MKEIQITTGLWIGDMTAVPYRPTYDVVLTVNDEPGHVDEQIKHRFIEMTDSADAQLPKVRDAVAWVRGHWEDGKTVLVRSEHGTNRCAYVVAALFIDMGADPDEAIASVRRRAPLALDNTDFLSNLTWM